MPVKKKKSQPSKSLPTMEEVIEFSKKFMYDQPGTENDLYSMFRPDFEKIIEFAQTPKSKNHE